MEVQVNWDDAKIKAANFNSRALNALFLTMVCEDPMVCGDFDVCVIIQSLSSVSSIFWQSEFWMNVLDNVYLVLHFFYLGLGIRFLCSFSQKT